MRTIPLNRLLSLSMCFYVTLATTSAFAGVLSYDGFAGYTVGNAAGQAYQGTGYVAGGTWTNNAFVDGGLTHPTLVTTPGVRVSRTSGDMIGNVDTSTGGPFGAAGLVGSNGNIGGAAVAGTLYYSFLGREIDANGSGWGGFNLWTGAGDEQFGIGNGGGPNDYVVYHHDAGEPPIGTPPTPIDGGTHLFVVRADYAANAKDTFTAWLDPDPTLGELAQNPNITVMRRSANEDDNDGFNQIRMRGDDATGQWEFDELRLGTTWTDVTPIPEPGTALLAVVGFSALAFYRLRRRRKC